VVVAFAAFVIYNGGIVVGDRSNHIAMLHFPQFLYFLLFTVIFLGCTAVNPWLVMRIWRANVRGGWVYSVVGMAAFWAAVKFFTFVHPFMLADNRHVPFYLVKDIYAKHWWVRYAFIPAYLYGAWAIHMVFGNLRSLLWQLVYFLCVLVVLVPTPLVEFRYYIIPFLVVQLHEHGHTLSSALEESGNARTFESDPQSAHASSAGTSSSRRRGATKNPRHLSSAQTSHFKPRNEVSKVTDVTLRRYLACCLNILFNVAVNVILLYLFLYRPFRWPDGSVARFMW